MKFKAPNLPSNPSPEKMKLWKKCFEDGLRITGTTEDADKVLLFLRTIVGSHYFTLLESSATFAGSLSTLDIQFLKPTRVLFARHQILSASQKDDESIVLFSGRLKRLVDDCECTSLTVQAHKDFLVRDTLISGLRSDDIRARLLELEDCKVDIDSCKPLACAIELSSDLFKPFRRVESSTVSATKQFSQTTRRQPDRTGISAAQQVSNKPRPRSTLVAPTTLRAMAETSVKTELCGRSFSACYTPQTTHSLTGNVSYHQRSHQFGHL